MSDPATVYVVDDDEPVRHAVCLFLQLRGYVVRPYDSGTPLLRDARPGNNSCLVIDLQMRGLSGLDVIEQLRGEGAVVPAILMTANATERVRAAAHSAKAAILEKPFRPDTLVDAIRRALDPTGIGPARA